MEREAINRRFAYHQPSGDDVKVAHEDTRVNFNTLAQWVNETLPDCPEKIKAIDSLDLAAMHTNAGIARTQLQRQALTG